MHSSVRYTLVFILGAMGLIVGLFVYRVINPPVPDNEKFLKYGYFAYPEARKLNDITLTDHHGQPFDLSELKGEQKTLVFFGFTTCPDVCPTTLSVLNQALQKTEQTTRVILITVDPERDTPERLANYVPAFNPAFIGLTGSFDAIVNIATQLNVAFGKVPGEAPNTYTVDHSANIALLDEQGRYAGFFRMPHQAENITWVLNRLD